MFRKYRAFVGLLVMAFALHLATVSIATAETYGAALLAYNAGDYATAFRIFSTLAERGHIRAQEELGRMYAKGEGVERNSAEA